MKATILVGAMLMTAFAVLAAAPTTIAIPNQCTGNVDANCNKCTLTNEWGECVMYEHCDFYTPTTCTRVAQAEGGP